MRPDFTDLIEELAAGGGRALADALPQTRHAEWLRGRMDAAEVLVGHMDLLAIPAA